MHLVRTTLPRADEMHRQRTTSITCVAKIYIARGRHVSCEDKIYCVRMTCSARGRHASREDNMYYLRTTCNTRGRHASRKNDMHRKRNASEKALREIDMNPLRSTCIT